MKTISEATALAGKGKPFRFWRVLESAQEELKGIKQNIEGKVEEGVAVKGEIFVGRGTVVKGGTRIEGNAYIGRDCVIGPNAFLRGGVMIADNCHIGTSEIKASIILSGSNVPHFSYVGNSLVGRNCNLGAGTKIANLRHDNAAVKVKIAGKTLDSGRRKLGALLLDGVKTGVNSSINCGAVLLPGTMVKPNEFVK